MIFMINSTLSNISSQIFELPQRSRALLANMLLDSLEQAKLLNLSDSKFKP